MHVHRHRRALHTLVVLLLANLATGSLHGQSSATLNAHPVKLDATGKLLAWPTVQGDAYGEVLSLAANYLLTGIPTASNGLKLYYSESYATGNPLVGAGWPHNPAGLYSMLTDSGLLFYEYSGNAAMTNLVRDVLTHQLDHGMTPSTWHWPGVAYASGDSGSLTYAGASYGNSTGVGDGVGVIQPDKVGEIGVAFLKYYEFSGTARFRDAAVQAADVLASHVRVGNATQSPWPFRVYAQTNVIREQYSAHVISAIQLFDELIRLNLGNVAAYRTARQAAWTWLMTYPIQNNVWATYFEDVAIQSDLSNVNQLNAGETARYLMRHPEFDPAWEAHVRGIIAWIEGRFAVPQYGATSIAEQEAFYYPMGSHTSRYASVNAQLYELTGDLTAKEKAYRSLNWATYMCGPTGIVIDGPSLNHIWFTDGYGDYIKHFLEGLGSVPEWAPAGQSHLLRSTSVVRNVQYAATEINYLLFDGSAQEVLRLNFTPKAVTADGVVLPNVPDLSQAGWTFNAATGVMRVRHDSGTQVRISGLTLNNDIPPTVSLDSPAAGRYAALGSLRLAATATDQDGTIDHVDFLQNGALLATSRTTPYEFLWPSVPSGTYLLTAAAVDDQGARTTSSPVSVVVAPLVLPPPPTTLVATVAAGTVNLTWTPPAGTPPASYRVHRSATSGFAPAAGTLIGLAATAIYADGGLAGGVYYYRVIAVDAAGAPSAASNEAIATIGSGLRVDKVVFSDGAGARTSPPISTAAAGGLLVAFAASDGPRSGGQTMTMTGAGLTWTLVARTNTQSGSAEIWKAVAPAVLANATVTSTPSRTGYDQSLTVVAFTGAGGTGASATASGVSAPSVSLTTTRAGSFVYGVANDRGAVARTAGALQDIVHQWADTAAGDTFWTQRRTLAVAAAGTLVPLNDAASAVNRWNFTAVEIVPPSNLVAVPATVGQSQAAAVSLLAAAQLGVGSVTGQSSATAPVNTVISQSPAGGAQVIAGSLVNLVISSGPLTITVPGVLGQTQTAALSQITGAGLGTGPVTRQASTTAPLNTVIGQSPGAGTVVVAGTPVSLVISSGPPGVVQVDQTVISDGLQTRMSPAFSTAAANEVLVAFVASDGPSSSRQSLTVSGAGLVWTLVKRANAQAGSAEIWWAAAVNRLTNVTVSSTPAITGYRQSLTVVAFTGARAVGASVSASAATGAPSVPLTTTTANALVYGVGNDWDRAVDHVPAAGQVVVHQWLETVVGDTYWVQAGSTPVVNAGTVVRINATSPIDDRWNLAAVEIVP